MPIPPLNRTLAQQRSACWETAGILKVHEVLPFFHPDDRDYVGS